MHGRQGIHEGQPTCTEEDVSKASRSVVSEQLERSSGGEHIEDTFYMEYRGYVKDKQPAQRKMCQNQAGLSVSEVHRVRVHALCMEN